jgi:hypothetical protein
MQRLRRAEIERRLAICEAYQQDPNLRYVDLQARFHTGPSIVASALKGGADTWLIMLRRAPPKVECSTPAMPGKSSGTRWEYLCVEIKSAVDAGGAIMFAAKEAGEDDPDLEGVKKVASVLGWYGKLGWELAGFKKVGKGGGAFDGAWEAVFKRPIASKGAGK